MIICLSGIVNFSQYGIDALTLTVFNGNPRPVNIFLTVVGFFVGLVLVTFVYHRVKVLEREKHNDEVDYERERLIPEEDEGMYNYGT